MILRGSRLYADPVACDGLLIVGDPHVSSRRPGRRVEKNWPEPILTKLQKCVEICNEQNLVMILLGDLFDTCFEPDEGLKTRLARILQDLNVVAISNTGNHDVKNITLPGQPSTVMALSDGDSLAYIGTTNVVDVVAKSGPVCEFILGEKRLGIGMTPYGQEIPRDVTGLFPQADAVAWFTHHDIAFENPYPGAIEPFEIAGCKLAINGHVHATKPLVRAGSTQWINPGNINRQSMDLIDHVPSAWILRGDGQMEPVVLPHERGAFDLTGTFVTAVTEKELVRDVDSAFVTLLRAETTSEMAISADGSLLAEDIEAKFESDGTDSHVRNIILSLLSDAVERRNAA